MDKEGLMACSIVFFTISFFAYVITIGVGWSLNQDVYPGYGLITAAAIVTAIPVFACLGYCIVAFNFNADSAAGQAAFGCFMCIVMFAGIFELVGAILFIVAGAQLKTENSKVLAYRASAGTFGLIAALSCCCSAVCCVGSD